jgi:predicted MFS family arabinose efflux permease
LRSHRAILLLPLAFRRAADKDRVGEGFMDSRLIWLALAAFVGATEGGLIAGLLPSIGEEMGVSSGQAGQLVFGYSLAYAIGTPALAVLLGGIGRRRILAGAELGLAVCALLLAIAPFFEWMVGARTLLAVCAGTYTGTAMATAAMIAPVGQRGRYMQVISVGQSIAAVAGVPLGAYVAAQFSWRINYGAIAVMAAAASMALYLRLPRGMPGDTQTMRERIRVLGNPGVMPALISTLLFMIGASPVMIYIGAIMSEAGLSHLYLPLVLLANGIGGLASSFTAGRLADWLGNRPTVTATSLMVIVLLAAYAALPHVPPDWRLPLLLVVLAVQGYVGWSYSIAVSSEMAHLAPSSVPVAISLNMAAFNIGMAIAAAAGGLAVDSWGASTLPFAFAPLVVVALAIWLAMPIWMRGGKS